MLNALNSCGHLSYFHIAKAGLRCPQVVMQVCGHPSIIEERRVYTSSSVLVVTAIKRFPNPHTTHHQHNSFRLFISFQTLDFNFTLLDLKENIF